MKKLYRSDKNKVFAGIIGGVAEFINVDATILRLIWVLIVVFTGFAPGILAYIIALMIVPTSPDGPVMEEGQ